MSSTVCQGLPSCLEPRLVESRVSIDKLAPPISNFSQSILRPQKPNVSQQQEEQNDSKKDIINNNNTFDDGECKSNKKDGDLGWSSFIQALANTSHSAKKMTLQEGEQVYVHPLVKRSSSTLSTKSLEMCTESLGCETGNNIDKIIADCSHLSLEKQNFPGTQRLRSREFTKKLDRTVTFPPPLTSISCTDGVQVTPHREGGRLVLKAVSSCNSCFQAERADGRLRLYSFLEDAYEEEVYEENHSEEFEHENADEEQQDYSEGPDVEADEDVKSINSEEDNMKGNGGHIIECEIEVEEFPRPRRYCKEDGPRNRGMDAIILRGNFLKAIFSR